MGKFTIENQSTGSYLVYEAALEERIDKIALEMLGNNEIPGVFPIGFAQVDDSVFFRYNITSKMSLRSYYSSTLNRQRLLASFLSITAATLAVEDYLLDPNALQLNLDHIFVDVSSGKAFMVYLPVPGATRQDHKSFFRSIMMSTTFDQAENGSYVARIINYLNGEGFQLSAFHELLRELDGAAHTGKAPKQAAVPAPGGNNMAPAQQPLAQSGMQQQPPAVSQQPLGAGNSGKMPQPGELVQPPPQPAHQPPAKKSKFSLFGGKKKKDPAPPAPPMGQPMPGGMPGAPGMGPAGGPPLAGASAPPLQNQPQQNQNAPFGAPMGVPGGPVTSGSLPEKDQVINGVRVPPSSNPVPPPAGGKKAKEKKKSGGLFKSKKQAPPAQPAQGAPPPSQVVPSAAFGNEGPAPGQPPMAQNQQGFQPPPMQGQPPLQPPPQQQPMMAQAPQHQGGPLPAGASPMQQPGMPPQQMGAPVPAAQPLNPNFGETTVLGGGGSDETTVLGEGGSPAAAPRVRKAYLVRESNNETIPLEKGLFRLGKDASFVDYALSGNNAISRSHADILRQNDEFFIVDNNSTNHTFVNGERIVSNTEHKLKDGSRIQLANECFTFRHR